MQDSIAKTLKKGVESGSGTAIVYAGTLGLLISDILPTPADAVFFYYERKNRLAYENKEITAQQYWIYETVNYYLWNPLWWLLVLGSVYVTKGDYTNKLKVGVGIIATGAIIGVIGKNIQEDIKQQKTIEIVPQAQ